MGNISVIIIQSAEFFFLQAEKCGIFPDLKDN